MSQIQVRVRPYPKVLDWLRYLCAFLLYLYGASKLAHFQFNVQDELAHRPIGSLNGYELTWFYYGYSSSYAWILGLLQLMGASLLLFRRSSLLGAALVTPMMANILLINIFFLTADLGRGPEFTSAFILASMLVLLWHERAALVLLFWARQPVESNRVHRWIRALILLAVAAVLIASILLQRHSK